MVRRSGTWLGRSVPPEGPGTLLSEAQAVARGGLQQGEGGAARGGGRGDADPGSGFGLKPHAPKMREALNPMPEALGSRQAGASSSEGRGRGGAGGGGHRPWLGASSLRIEAAGLFSGLIPKGRAGAPGGPRALLVPNFFLFSTLS